MKKKLFSWIAVGAVLVGAGPAVAEESADIHADNSAAVQIEAVSEEEALANWAKVFETFSHPRCANCHVPDDNRPRWSGPSYGDGPNGQGWRYHGMNIHGGESRFGVETLPCTACHAATNSDMPHGPPGSPVWALAPVEMVWWQRSSLEICEQIKDPERNGGRTLEEVADHVSHDALVHWGWDPGPGREPAPYSAEEVTNYIRVWAASGAPCPSGASEEE